jgi:hypothetical protein
MPWALTLIIPKIVASVRDSKANGNDPVAVMD